MSFLDVLSFKKKKIVPLKELELPPPANEALATGYNELEDIPPYREIDTPSFHHEDFSAPFSFDQPQKPSATPSGLFDIPRDMPMPLPFEREMRMKEEQQKEQHEEKHPEQLSLFSDIPQTQQFRFYEAPTDIDIANELLAVPKEQKPILKEQKKEFVVVNKKQFIPVTTLGDLGEQLFHLQDDLSLAKDTAFRVADLNEQEIEQLAKWQTLCNSMELRFAEVDKILFKV